MNWVALINTRARQDTLIRADWRASEGAAAAPCENNSTSDTAIHS
jgi:hypothetical protein